MFSSFKGSIQYMYTVAYFFLTVIDKENKSCNTEDRKGGLLPRALRSMNRLIGMSLPTNYLITMFMSRIFIIDMKFKYLDISLNKL